MTGSPAPQDLPDRHSLAQVLPDRSAHLAAGMAAVTERLGGSIAFGGDYNPEQWPESVWPEDVALMRQAGVNLVSVGIFSWALLEPAPGEYDFGWLDRVLDLLHDGGIAVDLANASATPPPWFSHRYPQSLLVDENGVRRSYGGRQGFCPSSPEYRTAATALTTAVAERYAGHPAVVMWHVHNEYGNHNWSCYCDVSAAAFQRWLQRRYGTLDELNTAWGTSFWSQHYYAWEEILPPRTPAYQTFANPTQLLDFSRFSSDELLDCFRAEAAILRERSPLPVTTNFMHFWKHVDYWAWSQEQDLISNDHYRMGALGEEAATHDLAMSADLIRSLADDAPWLLMEHSTSAVNWQPRNLAKGPGQMRRDSLTHVARGADGALFFQWRASRAGAEKYHSGMLPHAGTDSRRWAEVCSLGKDLGALAEITGSRAGADIAIAFDWSAWWGVELNSHPSSDVEQMDRVRAWHRALWQAGHPVDFVHPDRDLSGYRVVLVPALYLVSDGAAANLSDFARSGGTVVVGYFSGIVDVDDHIRLGGYPGAFTDLLGLRTEEFSPLLADDEVGLTVDAGIGTATVSTATRWTELVTHLAPDVQVLATFDGGVYPGEPAVTRRVLETGSGTTGSAWYIATEPAPELLSTLLLTACRDAGSRPALELEPWPAGLDAVIRTSATAQYLFLFNHSDVDIAIPAAGTDLLTGEKWLPGMTVPGGGAAVLASSLG